MQALPDMRNYPPGNSLFILIPELAIFRGTSPVIVTLPCEQKENVVERVKPRPDHAGITGAKYDTCGHKYLPEVINVPADAPEPVYKESVIAIPDYPGFDAKK